MTRYTTTDVLICGAGVTGLTLAIELARHGVSFRLIEKRTTPFIGSRGKGIQPRTQEIFEDLGILNKVVAAGGLYPRLRTYRHDGSYVDSDILAPGICQPPQLILPIVRTSEIGARQSVSSQAALV